THRLVKGCGPVNLFIWKESDPGGAPASQSNLSENTSLGHDEASNSHSSPLRSLKGQGQLRRQSASIRSSSLVRTRLVISDRFEIRGLARVIRADSRCLFARAFRIPGAAHDFQRESVIIV